MSHIFIGMVLVLNVSFSGVSNKHFKNFYWLINCKTHSGNLDRISCSTNIWITCFSSFQENAKSENTSIFQTSLIMKMKHKDNGEWY